MELLVGALDCALKNKIIHGIFWGMSCKIMTLCTYMKNMGGIRLLHLHAVALLNLTLRAHSEVSLT